MERLADGPRSQRKGNGGGTRVRGSGVARLLEGHGQRDGVAWESGRRWKRALTGGLAVQRKRGGKGRAAGLAPPGPRRQCAGLGRPASLACPVFFLFLFFLKPRPK